KAARKALRPSQRQSVLDARTVDTIEKKEMRTTMLDEVYEEALESTAARLKSKPARFEVVEASMNTVVIDLRVRFMKKNLHIVASGFPIPSVELLMPTQSEIDDTRGSTSPNPFIITECLPHVAQT
ncbi:hypothetical protein CYMTET_42179, partial [Cymbomonas tetramitiformis]